MSLVGEPLPEPLPALAPHRSPAPVEQFAAPATNPDLEKYLAEDHWAPTAHWLQARRERFRERRASFVGHFIDTSELQHNLGRKVAILAGCVGFGVLALAATPTPDELYEQTHPVTPTTTTSNVNDDCGNRVAAIVRTFPEYADETPLMLSRCRDGQSLVIQTMIDSAAAES